MCASRIVSFLDGIEARTTVVSPLMSQFPPEYDFRSSRWYRSLSEKAESFKSRLIITSISVASLIPIAFTIDDLLSRRGVGWINYGIPFITLMGMLWAFLRFRRVGLASRGVMLMGLLGFLVCLFLPNTRSVYVMIFFVYPFLATLLFGRRRAFLWHAHLAILGLLSVYLSRRGVLPPLTVAPVAREAAVCLATYAVISMIAYFIDAQNEAYNSSLILEGLYDSATGFPNRAMFDHMVPASRDSVVILARIKHQEELRSFWGGDAVNRNLRDLMEHLKRYEGCRILPFRFDEYEIGCLVTCPGGGGNEALREAHAAFSSFLFDFNGYRLKPDVRIGGAWTGSCEVWDPGTLVSRAFLALQQALNRNLRYYGYRRDECALAAPPITAVEFDTLRQALETGWYSVLFQPVMDVLEGRPLYYEALFRVLDEAGIARSIYPFLKTAESSGLDEMITDIVLEEAAAMIRETGSRVSVNIAYSDIRRGTLAERMASPAFEDLRGNLVLELLEVSDLKIESPECRDFITAVSSLGIEIAIDDFGSGYANLTQLVGLPISMVKIEGSLVRSLADDPERKDLIAGLISFCEKTGKQVIAEWVETEEIRDMLLDMGIRYMQGYLLGRPGVRRFDPSPRNTGVFSGPPVPAPGER